MSIVTSLVADFVAATAELDDLVASIGDAAWSIPTPAPRWTIAHQIAHLSWTDRVSVCAATDPGGFAEVIEAAVGNPLGFADATAAEGAAQPPKQILDQWRHARRELARALVSVPEGEKIAWFGPPMSAASMATARLMEVWAHGLDIADALDAHVPVTDRIRSVVHLGVRTRDYAYMVNGRTAPPRPFRYEITAPSGTRWTWGPDDPDAVDGVVRGPAFDFCALVTQRRAVTDLDLEFIGEHARQWSGIAQCFAGPPGPGRESVRAAHINEMTR
ncbi:MAG: TIGR03084 family metal-binding protein [Gordonia sp. (in: high G+C Gram-positive bacteria)]